MREHIFRGKRDSALRAQEKEPCEFCGRGKPIKAFTVLQPSGIQYGTSVKAMFCPVCGRALKGEKDG
jgi:hypothetical protein